ncbi:hypothetical protein GGR54DRAFT_636193 [Hypoxylon sp. NC1633]|nr:hypothetical protein GGR54DRAFT_636193 [Hypoxylon sp. NC1633]
MPQPHPEFQVVFAPSTEFRRGNVTVFLAGTTTKTPDRDWREVLTESLVDLPVTVINPYRPDWDPSWQEEVDCNPFYEQVEWELSMQEQADLVVFYFHPVTEAPVSLLELGLSARTEGKAIVVCLDGYKKRGNVDIVCRRYGVEQAASIQELRQAIEEKLPIV